MLLRICHTTRFEYEKPAYHSHNEVRMKPRDGHNQRCLNFELEVTPEASVFECDDYFGNRVHAFSIDREHRSLTVAARSIVERMPEPEQISSPKPFNQFLLADSERVQSEFDFLSASRHVPFSEPMKKFFWLAKPDNAEDVATYVMRVVSYINGQFEYEPGKTRVHSTADEILIAGGGVCQDFTHLTIGVLRLAGIPARYVSGYLAPLANTNATSMGGQASHAWLEAQVPGMGWTGFDPTNGCKVDERHVRVAIGRDYSDVPPMRGVYRSAGSHQSMTVELKVELEPEPQKSSGQQSQQ